MRYMLLWIVSSASLIAQGVEVEGTVTGVTLYRGQAMVTRSVELPDSTGALQLTVIGLPHGVLGDSVFAEAGDGVEVRAVRYRTRTVREEASDRVRSLDEEIQSTRDALASNESSRGVVEKRVQYLDKLEGFVAPTAHGDLQKGALDAEALERLVLFGFKQREEARESLMTLQREARTLQEKLALLQRQRAELHQRSSNTVREAVIFLEKREPGQGVVSLNYMVKGCGWAPSYNLRALKDSGKLRVEYNALIQQTTGEDWENVELTLSTATPALSAAGPGLAPFSVALGPGPRQPQTRGQSAAKAYASIAQRQRDGNNGLLRAFNNADNFEAAWSVNVAANELQTLEIITGAEAFADAVRSAPAAGAGPSLAYPLGARVSLANRADTQMVRIVRAELASDFYHVATPVLTHHIYREGRAVNLSGYDLLAGSASVYLDGRFVGRAEMSSVAQGETFVIGLGADPRMRARREMVSKKSVVQGGNRVIDIKMRLEVENFHSEPISLRLLDRLPHTDRDRDLRVALGETSEDLSKDGLYVRTDRPLGILRWDLEVPASAIQQSAKVVTYGYSLEFDRSLALTSIGQEQGELREAFQQLLKERGVR